jgi:hypothetical protein
VIWTESTSYYVSKECSFLHLEISLSMELLKGENLLEKKKNCFKPDGPGISLPKLGSHCVIRRDPITKPAGSHYPKRGDLITQTGWDLIPKPWISLPKPEGSHCPNRRDLTTQSSGIYYPIQLDLIAQTGWISLPKPAGSHCPNRLDLIAQTGGISLPKPVGSCYPNRQDLITQMGISMPKPGGSHCPNNRQDLIAQPAGSSNSEAAIKRSPPHRPAPIAVDPSNDVCPHSVESRTYADCPLNHSRTSPCPVYSFPIASNAGTFVMKF